jgi:hypothetical protein
MAMSVPMVFSDQPSQVRIAPATQLKFKAQLETAGMQIVTT